MTTQHRETKISGIPEAGAGALAAELLMNACDTDGELQLMKVRDLALSLSRELEVLCDSSPTPDALAAAAARCADLASLAACNLPLVESRHTPGAAAATHLASGAARALGVRLEAAAMELDSPRGEYLIRESRGTAWRAQLATRQTDEFLTPPQN